MALDFGGGSGLFTTSNYEGESASGQNVIMFEDLNANPLNSAGILSSTINHIQTGSFFNILDEDTTSSLKFELKDTSTTSSNFTIDLGRILQTSVIGTYFILKTSAGVRSSGLKIEYSTDNTNWTTWLDETINNTTTETHYDEFLFNKSIRYLKFTIATTTIAALEGSIDLRILKITR